MRIVVIIVLLAAIVVALLLAGWFYYLPRSVEANQRQQSAANLKRIGMAMHYYNGDFRQLPPADGSPLAKGSMPLKYGEGLSWRVHLLPCVHEKELYKQFRLNEPWDSPHNMRLLPEMPAVYQVPASAAEPGYTHYRVFVDEGLFSPANKGKPRSLYNVPDGLTDTIMVVEAAEAVPWTKPDELIYKSDEKLPPLKKWDLANRFQVLMADGAVFNKANSIPEQTLRRAIHPDNGKPEGPEWTDK